MRRPTRTIIVLAAPVLTVLAFGCKSAAPTSAPEDARYLASSSYDDSYGGDHAGDDYGYAEQDYAQPSVVQDGSTALTDSEPAPELERRSEPEPEPMDSPSMVAESESAEAPASRARRGRRSARRDRRSRRQAKDLSNRRVASGSTTPVVAEPPPPATKVAVSPLPPPASDNDAYDRIVENDFVAVIDDALSTFSIDVDTASYSNTRRFLNEGRLPPADAVRIEEMVNYFAYDYPQPTGDDPFSVVTEVAPCPWNSDHRLVHIGLQGKDIAAKEVPARNLVFLLDVSGSMSDADKLPLLKRGMHMLADQIRPQDRVSIVVYAGASGVVLEPTSDRAAIKAALDRLEAGGSTNGGAGIELAYRLATDSFVKGGINRVLLATDGDFNVGTTSQGDLSRLIEAKRESGVFLSVLGFGRGNLGDSTMEQLADKGNGNYAYIDSGAEAHKVLVEQAGATLVTIAKDVKIQVELNPAEVAAYRLVGYENRKLAHRDFNDDTKDAGEIGAGHTVTALYEVVPVGQGTASDVDALEYQAQPELSAAAGSGELMTVKLRYKRPSGKRSILLSTAVHDADGSLSGSSEDFRFSAAVAELGLLLRGSKWRGEASFTQAYELAASALGHDEHGRRAELLGLVQQAASLSGESIDVPTRRSRSEVK